MKSTTILILTLVVFGGSVFAQKTTSSLEDDLFLNGSKTLKAFETAGKKAMESTVQFVRDEIVFILGTVVDERGYVVTKASEFEDGKPFEVEISNGDRVEAKIIDSDRKEDLALVKIPAGKVTPVKWGETKKLFQGQWVAAPSRRAKKLAAGVVSAKRRDIPRRGGVLGILLDRNDDADALGVGIDAVRPKSPAQKIGMLVGDLIVAVEDDKIHSRKELTEAVGKYDPGETIKVTIERGEENISLWPTLEHKSKVFDPLDRNQRMSGKTSKRKMGFTNVIQTDLPLEPEAMGSPVVDLFGNVLGINIAKYDRVTTYSVPSEVARRVIADLIPAQPANAEKPKPGEEDAAGN